MEDSVKITLPIPPLSASPNSRKNWRTKAREFKRYKKECVILIREQIKNHRCDLPFDECVARIVWYSKTKNYLDRDNALASLKAAGDAIEFVGIVLNDQDIIPLPIERAKDKETPRVEIELIDKTGKDLIFSFKPKG